MMTSVEIALLILLGYAVFWVVKVNRTNTDPLSAFKSFGAPSGKSRPLRPEERDALFYAAVRQQKIAFGVLVLAVTVGVLLGAALLGRIVFAAKLDLELLVQAIALAGDLALCHRANGLNKDATARLRSVVTMITAA